MKGFSDAKSGTPRLSELRFLRTLRALTQGESPIAVREAPRREANLEGQLDVSQIRVLLVDDSDDFLDVVSEWLTADPGIAIVGTARTGCEAVARVEELEPDVVLMDVTMPGMNGFEATRSIKSKPDSPLVVLLAFHDSETARHAAWAAGADDLMAKANVTAGLLTLVRDLVAGRQPAAQVTGEKKRSKRVSKPLTKQGPSREI